MAAGILVPVQAPSETMFHNRQTSSRGRGVEEMDIRGLRSYRLNLISAHTCVGKPPGVIAFSPSFGGKSYKVTDFLMFDSAKIRLQTGKMFAAL